MPVGFSVLWAGESDALKPEKPNVGNRLKQPRTPFIATLFGARPPLTYLGDTPVAGMPFMRASPLYSKSFT